MSTYEFQILRYRPDQVSEEFVNVGLVFYEPQSRFLRSHFLQSTSRITCFFPKQDGRQIHRRLRHLDGVLAAHSHGLVNDLVFEIPDSVIDVTRRFLTPDDTSLYFSDKQRGMDDDLEMAFEELVERLIENNIVDTIQAVKSDHEVWARLFKPFFSERGIASRLRSHSVATANDSLEFPYAWKNELWHCYQPLALDLKRSDSIKNKVYRWVGKFVELSTSEEALDIQLLATVPENNPELLAFILEQLDQKVFGASTVRVVQQQNVQDLAEHVRAEMVAHDEEENLF